ncbi:prepilin peptidase [Gudongella sp. DL1XJH-153]|uniref:prepilin peptidase n=1 Tax=Gudongella sp. DL1XJH-153 TaxID=3409804 RepID=UPI003BB80B88
MVLLIFIYGLLIGSFLNVLIYRIPRDENIAWPGSHCTSCEHDLKWYDNIPLFSYLFLKGKCRYCGEKISIQYPVVEASNAIIYVLLFLSFYYNSKLDFVFFAFISSILIAIAFIDLKDQIIPDSLVITVLVLSILQKTLLHFYDGVPFPLMDSLLGLFIAGGIFLLIVFFSGGGMGGGDVTLIAALGFILGVRLIFLNIFLAFILGAVISIFLLATKIKSRKDPIPFGPFIILGFFMVLFLGEELLSWYFNILI